LTHFQALLEWSEEMRFQPMHVSMHLDEEAPDGATNSDSNADEE
jgi:hypothetical protein